MVTDIQNKNEPHMRNLNKRGKDKWDILKILTSILIPFIIGIIGWYFTNDYNRNQLQIQKINNENQLQIALINANVRQSELIKDMLHDLTSEREVVRIAAIEAVLYAAPDPGKRIVDVLAKLGDRSTKIYVDDALATKRKYLSDNMFSEIKSKRIESSNEILSIWSNDEKMLSELVEKSIDKLAKKDSCIFNDTIMINTIKVISLFAPEPIRKNIVKIKKFTNYIPLESHCRQDKNFEFLNGLK